MKTLTCPFCKRSLIRTRPGRDGSWDRLPDHMSLSTEKQCKGSTLTEAEARGKKCRKALR